MKLTRVLAAFAAGWVLVGLMSAWAYADESAAPADEEDTIEQVIEILRAQDEEFAEQFQEYVAPFRHELASGKK